MIHAATKGIKQMTALELFRANRFEEAVALLERLARAVARQLRFAPWRS